MSFRKYRTANAVGHVQQIPFEKFTLMARNYLLQAVDPNNATGRMALDNFGRLLKDKTKPWEKIGDSSKLSTPQVDQFDRAIDDVLTQTLNYCEPITPAAQSLVMSQFATGKACTVRDDTGNLWTCTITISAGTWREVESYGAGMAISSIKGILSADPILVSPISTSTGKRCIKPEPYGWIFSTSSSVRLVDTATPRQAPFRPNALTFTTIRNVK